jgi:hypothetical protein
MFYFRTLEHKGNIVLGFFERQLLSHRRPRFALGPAASGLRGVLPLPDKMTGQFVPQRRLWRKIFNDSNGLNGGTSLVSMSSDG